MISSSGSAASARAISTRWCWPPESASTESLARSAMPTSSSAWRTASRSARRSTPKRVRESRPEETTSVTVAGTPPAAVVRWGTYPTRRQSRNRRRGVPNSSTSPEVTGTWPITVRTAVDLPEPLAPSRATTSPRRTVRSMPRSTGREPSSAVTPRRAMTGSASPSAAPSRPVMRCPEPSGAPSGWTPSPGSSRRRGTCP